LKYQFNNDIPTPYAANPNKQGINRIRLRGRCGFDSFSLEEEDEEEEEEVDEEEDEACVQYRTVCIRIGS
jgi:hypothetical protein